MLVYSDVLKFSPCIIIEGFNVTIHTFRGVLCYKFESVDCKGLYPVADTEKNFNVSGKVCQEII